MNTDERRLLLAFVLSLAVFLAYEFCMSLLYPEYRKPRRPPAVTALSDTEAALLAVDTGQPGVAESSTTSGGVLPAVEAIREETDVLAGAGYEITTTNAGAGIRRIRLFGIPRIPHKDTQDISLVDDRQPQAFGALRLPSDSGYHMFRRTEATPSRVRYVSEGHHPRNPDMRYEIERIIEVSPNKYEVRMTTLLRHVSGGTLQMGGDSSTAIGMFLPPFPEKRIRSDVDLNEIHVKLGEDVETRKEVGPGFLGGLFGRSEKRARVRESHEGVVRWIALGDRYFTTLLAPDSPLQRVTIDVDGPMISAEAQYGTWTLEPGGEKRFQERLYAGPKMPDLLEAYGKDILEVMNFGWFHKLGFAMLWLMKLFYKLIPNYGVAIILLTVVVRIVLYPLTYKSYVSMAKLKELAPKMKDIQEKYKNNSEKMQKEMMKMYQENKVNPAGGCLPILLQIPVFIAFYSMLQYAIELRGARFLWLLDLAEKDPYYVLPVLMGVSMIIQQKMTPSPDPNQAKIGMFMTGIFTFLFLTFPSGLVLYWLVSNILGIWQQKIIEKKLKPTPSP